MEMAELILSELKSLNIKLDDLSADTKQRLTHLETQTKPLFSNGQPGLCERRLALVTKLDTAMSVRVTALEKWRAGLHWWLAGAGSVITFIGAILGVLGTWAFEWFVKVHKG
jgi:hypothetical protein